MFNLMWFSMCTPMLGGTKFCIVAHFLIMLRRSLVIVPSEFSDVLELETTWETPLRSMFMIRIRVPVNSWNFVYGFNFSCECSRGVVPNQISREIFHLMNFLEQDDWREKLDSYADFCDGRF